ncbi:organomercurial lyase MerB [Amycolatopsis sp. NPDC006131]|uniref:organomercurial lyase MerB n=1 Tax=Amycolatopsis sp. NPDC006131 TaxID=3156731 RepID=UPI0033A47038
MSTPAEELVDQLAGALHGTGHPATQPWLFRPLLRLLAEGEPVALDRLADAAGTSVDQVRQALAAEPDTEYDADGRVVGLGLTQNPTPHRVETNGRTLYGWCAMDTLMFPLILQRPVRVISTCPATRTAIRLTAEPERVTDLDPATAVVSQVPAPEGACGVRASVCDQGHFFASAQAATDWQHQHPESVVLPVADGHRFGRRLLEALFSADAATGAPALRQE